MKLTIEYKGATLVREESDGTAAAVWVYIERAEDLEVMLDPEDAGLSQADADAAQDLMDGIRRFLYDHHTPGGLT